MGRKKALSFYESSKPRRLEPAVGPNVMDEAMNPEGRYLGKDCNLIHITSELRIRFAAGIYCSVRLLLVASLRANSKS